MCEICSKVKNTPGVCIVNFEQISYIILVFPVLILNQ